MSTPAPTRANQQEQGRTSSLEGVSGAPNQLVGEVRLRNLKPRNLQDNRMGLCLSLVSRRPPCTVYHLGASYLRLTWDIPVITALSYKQLEVRFRQAQLQHLIMKV